MINNPLKNEVGIHEQQKTLQAKSTGTYISLLLPMMAYLWNLNRKQWIISGLIRGNPASLKDKFQ